ncbi:MAG: DNA polymerase III subunit alpha, partial [Muribaculaceae bacterium]|nr:DNA polymerase III subunit alpha [Muribaculaceae bacterium]
FTQDENGNVVLSKEEADKKIERLGGDDKLYRIKFEADYLAKLAMDGAKERYGDPLPEDVAERIKFELYIMKTMGFPGYFLIVQDFINVGRKKLGVSVGPGRGSAAGSAVAYCLGITQVDPIKYDLLFERFLNPDRISLPDIDVDFDDDGRYEVLKYVTERYGEEKVAHIITYQTMATKMAIKDVAKVLEVPLSESNRIAKLVPDRLMDKDGKSQKINFKNLLKYCDEFAAETNSPNPGIRETMKYAQQLEGNIRGTGIHACGVIISRDDITDWVPVSMATDADGTKVISTQYEGSVIEDTGLIKMDFLGLKTLSIIKETLANIKNTRGFDLDIDNIPLDDKATYELYCKGNTTSTFQFESAGMQKYLRELQPSKFEDLIAMNALYRPGPMDYIPSFIARKHGIEPIEYDIPIMSKYLEETYGICVYQEQVMLLSRLLANFTRGESDMLRKAMGKKLIDKMQKLKVKFIDQGKANGYEEKTLDKIWADWEKFASYAFNKSHATCYSWVAYQTGYLKANFPAEYMAGVMSRNLASADKIKTVMDECVRMGITVKGPDINESVEKFGVNQKGDIRFGLAAIKGVGVNAVAAIIQERKINGPFKDRYDFVERVNLNACNKNAVENLAMAGAFDCFQLPREAFITKTVEFSWAELLVKYGQNVQKDKNSLQMSLFGDVEMIETNKPPMPEYIPWTRLALLDKEKELVTMYLSAHPLDPYWTLLNHACNTSCEGLKEKLDKAEAGTKFTIGGLITKVSEKVSKKGNSFTIVEIEDFTGKGEIALFGGNYTAHSAKFKEGEAVMVKISFQPGRFNPGRVDMRIDEVTPLDNLNEKEANAILLMMDINENNRDLFSEIERLDAKKRPGDLFLELFDTKTRQTVKIHSRKRFSIDKEFIEVLQRYDCKFKVFTNER